MATPPTNDNDDDGRLDQSIAEEFVARARAEGVDLVGPGGLLGDLTKQILETGLEGTVALSHRARIPAAESDANGPRPTLPPRTTTTLSDGPQRSRPSKQLNATVPVIGWTAQGAGLTSGSAGLLVSSLPNGEQWHIDDPRARKLVTPEPVASLGPLDRG